MSNTYKTNKARTARKLGKTLNKELNAILRGDVAGINDSSHYNEYQKEIQNLQVESHRYGNQRHAHAQTKVDIRRAERASHKVETRKRIEEDM